MEKITSCKATLALSAIWFLVFGLSKITNISTMLCGKGMSVIGNEYWRFLTAVPFLQLNTSSAVFHGIAFVVGAVMGVLPI